MQWEPVIGLEIHVQLATHSKLFSGAATAYGAAPNSQACAVDLGLPGVLPVINEAAVRMAVRFGLAVEAEVTGRSVFARKNYFYPDLPKGYQISQYELPVVGNGRITIRLEDGTEKIIGITRAHLEEDAGKSVHENFSNATGIDLNRAGTPLIEIVSEPDMRSAFEAAAYMRKIHTLVRYLGISDGNMQEGSFRCDANVSLRPVGETEFGTRAEIKNINSFRFVEQAINYEIERQTEILESGGEVIQETRLFDAGKGETRSMRTKEEANDYRYFPDPDLLPVVVTEDDIESIRAELPELPDAKRRRFMTELGLSEYDSDNLSGDIDLAAYFEATVAAAGGEAKLAANWIMGELAAALNREDKAITESKRRNARRPDTTHQGQHHLHEDRQAGVRGHVERRRRRRYHHRIKRPEAGHRHQCDRKNGGRSDRSQSGTGGAIPPGQGKGPRLLRRPGYETESGQGQPPAG